MNNFGLSSFGIASFDPTPSPPRAPQRTRKPPPGAKASTTLPADHTAELAELRQAVTALSRRIVEAEARAARQHHTLSHRIAEIEPPAPRMVLVGHGGRMW